MDHRVCKSYAKTPIKVLSASDLSPMDKFVYGVLDSFSDGKTGESCFPSYTAIANRAKVSVSTVKVSIKRLRNSGYLSWIRGKKGMANLYLLLATYGPSVTHGGVTSNLKIGSRMTYHQEPTTKNYDPPVRDVLFHGNDRCFVKDDGSIRIHNRNGEWVDYGGGDEGAFRFGELRGAEARRAAQHQT